MLRRLPSLLAVAALVAASASAQRPIPARVGFAFGDGVYRIETEPVRGEGALLAGEAVSTGYLPARLHLGGGAFAILGIGSHARVYADYVRVSGVSLEMLRFGEAKPRIEAGPVVVVPVSPDARVSVFVDRPETVTVFVSKGDVEVRSVAGRVLRQVTGGVAVTFLREPEEIRIEESRAAAEIIRICRRQVEFLGTLDEYVPGIGPRRRALLERLREASGDSEAALAAAREVHFRLNQEGLGEAGCGEPECAAGEPSRWRNRFFGWAGGYPTPPPGCALCQPGDSNKP